MANSRTRWQSHRRTNQQFPDIRSEAMEVAIDSTSEITRFASSQDSSARLPVRDDCLQDDYIVRKYIFASACWINAYFIANQSRDKNWCISYRVVRMHHLSYTTNISISLAWKAGIKTMALERKIIVLYSLKCLNITKTILINIT